MPGSRKLGRASDHRLSMLRGMVTYLLEKGKIETTVTRAKEVRSMTEKMITTAKESTLAAKRRVLGFVTKEDVVKKLFDETAPKYAGINGGYVRIVRSGPRRGDAAEMCILELIDPEEGKKTGKKKTARKSSRKDTAAKEKAKPASKKTAAKEDAKQKPAAPEETVEESAPETAEAAQEASAQAAEIVEETVEAAEEAAAETAEAAEEAAADTAEVAEDNAQEPAEDAQKDAEPEA